MQEIAGGAGTQTAALAIWWRWLTGKQKQWNGTSWTEVNDLNTARYLMGSGGTSTSAMAGWRKSAKTGKTELWNGTSWTEVNDLNTARQISAMGVATNSTASYSNWWIFTSPPYSAAVEEFTGAGADIGAWSTGASMNSARAILLQEQEHIQDQL